MGFGHENSVCKRLGQKTAHWKNAFYSVRYARPTTKATTWKDCLDESKITGFKETFPSTDGNFYILVRGTHIMRLSCL